MDTCCVMCGFGNIYPKYRLSPEDRPFQGHLFCSCVLSDSPRGFPSFTSCGVPVRFDYPKTSEEPSINNNNGRVPFEAIESESKGLRGCSRRIQSPARMNGLLMRLPECKVGGSIWKTPMWLSLTWPCRPSQRACPSMGCSMAMAVLLCLCGCRGILPAYWRLICRASLYRKKNHG